MRAVLEPVPLQGLASVQSVCFFWKEVIEKVSPALTVSLRSTALHTKVPQSLLKLRAISHVCGFRSVLRRAPRGLLRRGRRLRSLAENSPGITQVSVWPPASVEPRPEEQTQETQAEPPLWPPLRLYPRGPSSHVWTAVWMRAMAPPQAPFHLMLSAINNKRRIEKPQSLMASQEDTSVNICLSCEMDTRRTNSGWVDLTKDIFITQEMIVCLFIYYHINW